jgi:hypothetical protein
MHSPVNDLIGRSLIVIFLTKPIVDLFWSSGMFVGGIALTPLTVYGALVGVYFMTFRLQRGRHRPPFAGVFELFLLVVIVPPTVRIALGDDTPITDVIDISLRMVDSYLIYSAAFLAAARYQYEDFSPIVKAIILGSGIAILINVVAIQLGFGGAKPEDIAAGAPWRERGLYYDAGAMSNVAVYSLLFCVFGFSVIRTSRAAWIAFSVLVIFCDLYLIFKGKSRASVIQIMAVGLLYFSLFQRSWGRIVAPVLAALVIGIATISFDVDYGDFFGRFERDAQALSDTQSGDVGITASGEVSLGKYEGLGNRRGAMWAEAFTEILQRDFWGITLGEFTRSVAHSDIVDVLARNGVIGFCLYAVLMCGLPLRAFGQMKRSQADASRTLHFMAFALLVAYVLYSFPFRPLNYTTTSWYMWAIVGLSMARMTVVRRAPGRDAQPVEDADKAPETHGPRPRWNPRGPAPAISPSKPAGRARNAS